MKPLSALRTQLAAGEFDLTRHALKRMVERNISGAEIQEAGGRAFKVSEKILKKSVPAQGTPRLDPGAKR
uniref:Uncharacterized protein n=1 Tax=Candidatus Kentrum sp. UNK TaxID=2126344 RepID=A0A450ZYE9_9GAMM|nr:MAG: hypothetical protein BECKUNK1418G_GA0071005_100519 [Candidatus Kentron sp. UNK]VFK68592.1 MAG: hypothetical protein BECKUNK1418H_GA0071006_100419 [Candidatus Kentron sp. UNK]